MCSPKLYSRSLLADLNVCSVYSVLHQDNALLGEITSLFQEFKKQHSTCMNMFWLYTYANNWFKHVAWISAVSGHLLLKERPEDTAEMLAGKYGTKCKHVQNTRKWNTLEHSDYFYFSGSDWSSLEMSENVSYLTPNSNGLPDTPFPSPEAEILLVSSKDQDLWPDPIFCACAE